MLTLAACLAAVFVLSGCAEDPTFLGAPDENKVQSLVLSPTWRATVDEADASARLDDLQKAIDELRTETSSGWVGRQDDVTGYLTELSGGRYFADAADPVGAANDLLDTYGPRLFGVAGDEMRFEEAAETDPSGAMVLRGEQVVGGVPVRDGALIVTIGDAEGEPRVNAIRGRAFSGIDVDTEPGIPARRATRIAARTSGGEPQGAPELVVVPGDGARLAWQIAVIGAEDNGEGQLVVADGIYFIDAQSGELVDIRAGSADARTLQGSPLGFGGNSPGTRTRGPNVLAQSAPDPQAVELTGEDPSGSGTTLTASGIASGGRVALVDTTVPSYDPATGRGAIYTYDARGSDDESLLPGKLYVERGTRISDPEALAAHSLSRVVYDYYASLGRDSWDGDGGSLVSSVNFGGDELCNAFFSPNSEQPQMIYGNPCITGGEPQETSTVEIDTAGHEITHGVIFSSSNLIYTGQSGAMSESFSDYFGNVIGNKFKGLDDARMFEGGCIGFSEPTSLCKPNPDGTLSLRYLLSGNTFEDYLYILNVPKRMDLLGANQDQGGVHLNSSIWNNALWSTRTRLAQMDGTTANESVLAQEFDKIVYGALTRLAPASSFLDARAALEETAIEAGGDPAILRVLQETMDFNKICDGCAAPEQNPAQVVSSASQTQLTPSVSGDRVAWLDFPSGGGIFGVPAESRIGGSPSNLTSSADTAQVTFAGDAVVAMELPGSVVRYGPDRAKTVLGEASSGTLLAGLGGSEDGAAWVLPEAGKVYFADPSGAVTEANLKGLGNEEVTSLGTGLGTVAFGTDGGSVFVWEPGGQVERVGNMTSGVLAVAAYGERILAVDEAGVAALFDLASGEATELSQDAAPFGAAISDEYAVWTNNRGALEGGVARTEGAVYPDTDLYMLSFETGQIYNLLPQRGQQGFPALSGDRLVWQDTVLGGDDVFTATLPPNL